MSILIFLLVAIVALLGYAATRPNSFRVERSANINAPPDKVFALINNFNNWTQWSPWERIDPNLKRAYSGAEFGRGAVYAWEGAKAVGQGRMEILESMPSSKIVIKLDILKPFEAHNTAEFTLASAGSGTHVTWAMYGPSPLMAKIMGLFVNMDKMVGKDFEAGLANLGASAEK